MMHIYKEVWLPSKNFLPFSRDTHTTLPLSLHTSTLALDPFSRKRRGYSASLSSSNFAPYCQATRGGREPVPVKGFCQWQLDKKGKWGEDVSVVLLRHVSRCEFGFTGEHQEEICMRTKQGLFKK
jgi:hypothetical protein